MAADQEDMLLQEAAMRLLCHLQCVEFGAVNEFKCRMDRLILRLRLEWDVLEGDKVDLEWVQFLAIEFREESLLTLHTKVQVMDSHRLHLVEFPLKLQQRKGKLGHERAMAVANLHQHLSLGRGGRKGRFG